MTSDNSSHDQQSDISNSSKNDHMHKKTEESESGWSPLRNHKIFLAFWIASIVSNLGSSMHDVSASWFMTTQTQSPLFVSLIPAVSSLAIVLFILFGGAFSDIFDRRRLLLFIQSWMMITALTMGIITMMDLMSPSLLLIFTFILGIGIALNMPLAIVTSIEMTSNQEKQATVTLGSISINIGRAAGPLIGGVVISLLGGVMGSGAVFLLNALTFVFMFYVVYNWKRKTPREKLPSEHVFEALRSGVMYVVHSHQAHAMFIRASSFIIFGSVIMAVLPVLVREDLGLGSTSFGILLSLLGIGSLIGGLIVLPRLRNRLTYERIIICSTILLAVVIAILGFVRDFTVLSVSITLGGIGWILIISSLHFSMSITTPKWVGSRGLAFYLLIFQSATAIGSIIWGLVATEIGIQFAFLFAAIGMVASLLAGLKYKLSADLELEYEPSHHWPSPNVVIEPSPEDGPIFVKIEYNIDPSRLKEFTFAMKELYNVRKRNGALHWRLYKENNKESLLIETFVVSSWAEHLRQHEQITKDDKKIQDHVNSFNADNKNPSISHLIAQHLPDDKKELRNLAKEGIKMGRHEK